MGFGSGDGLDDLLDLIDEGLAPSLEDRLLVHAAVEQVLKLLNVSLSRLVSGGSFGGLTEGGIDDQAKDALTNRVKEVKDGRLWLDYHPVGTGQNICC